MITAADIKRLFERQLEKIGDEALRNKVVDVWVLGCRKGGWETVEELTRLPFTLLAETKGISFIEHTIAVTEGALALARAQLDTYKKMPYQVNLDRLVAGGLLHDVGKLMEIARDGSGGFKKSRAGEYARHPISGAIIAAEAGAGPDIVNTIACHAKEGEGAPQVLETVFIHQADFATFNPLVMMGKGLLIQ